MDKMTPWTLKLIHSYSKSCVRELLLNVSCEFFYFFRTTNRGSTQQLYTVYQVCSSHWIQQGNKTSVTTYSCSKELKNLFQEMGNACDSDIRILVLFMCICFHHLVPFIYMFHSSVILEYFRAGAISVSISCLQSHLELSCT